MLSIWILLKDLRIMLRDKRALLTLIVMPLILIGILGLAFSNLFSVDESENQAVISFSLAVVDLDHTEHSGRIVDEVLAIYLKDYVDVTVMSIEEAEKGLANDTIKQALIIPEGFGELINNNEQASGQLITKGDASILQSIIGSALQQYSLINAGIEGTVAVLTDYAEKQSLMQSSEALQDESLLSSPPLGEWSGQSAITEPIIEENVKGEARTVGSFQYYAVAMGVMFLLMTVVSLVRTMIEEKNEPVYDRQLITKMYPWHYLLGKFFGIFVISMLQLTVIITGTAIIFGVDWGDSISGLLLTMVSFTMSTSGLAVFVGSFIKQESVFSNIGMIGTQLLSALGGSFVPFYMFPEWMQMLSKVIPNALALHMFIELMTGGTSRDIWQEASVASLVGVVLMLVAWLRLARKGGASRV